MKGKVKTLIVFESLAAFIGIVSAIGSSCPTFNPPTDILDPLYIMNELQWVFIITTLLTYLAAIASGVLIWALIARKTWFYLIALITSFVGFISGITPALLVILNGMPFSPSLMRTVIYAIIAILLLLPPFYELKFKKTQMGIKDQEDDQLDSKTLTSSKKRNDLLPSISLIGLGIGFALLIQPFMVSSTHVKDGVSYFGNPKLYIYFGISIMVLSVALFVIYAYLRYLYSSRMQEKESLMNN